MAREDTGKWQSPQSVGSDAALPDDALRGRDVVKLGLDQTHLVSSPLLSTWMALSNLASLSLFPHLENGVQ